MSLISDEEFELHASSIQNLRSKIVKLPHVDDMWPEQPTPTSNNTELEKELENILGPNSYMYGQTILRLIKKETDKARVSGFSVGDTVINTSGWGVGSQTKIPLTIKTILLKVGWENAKSTRYLNSTDVELASINVTKEKTDE